PYVAGEVQPQTLEFVNLHLSGCEACRGALAQLSGGLGQPVAPPPPADAGRQVVNRVRRNVLVLIAVVVLALGAAGGSLYFAIHTIFTLAGMNVPHIVPPDRYKIAEVVERVDLTPAGLRLANRGSNPVGNEYRYEQADGRQVTVTYGHYGNTAQATQAFRHWFEDGPRTMSVETGTSLHRIAKFRRAGQYYYGWQAQNWVIIIEVPGTVRDPAALRDEVRDLLRYSFSTLQP
ncbi:MAG TPA: zf-HC2 domain-containing protein, partial [Symbiobacteriaceae bacterium]|nr:zf-HC2 domain-containing protein [Symbiobacteriaceae bacterium]